jgi:hypothetical protein
MTVGGSDMHPYNQTGWCVVYKPTGVVWKSGIHRGNSCLIVEYCIVNLTNQGVWFGNQALKGRTGV